MEVKILWGDRLQEPQAKRKADAVRQTLKEARSKGLSRRTETEYEATPIGVNGQTTVKPPQSRVGGVDSAVVD